jgi:hypothetical protein
MKNTLKLVILLPLFAIGSLLRAGPIPSAADVGDADSFGHSALYMGAVTGTVQLPTTPCSGPPPVPGDGIQCFQITPSPAVIQTNFSAQDICRIKLPKKATRTVIYPVLNMFVNYELQNSTGVYQPQGVFAFRASLDIESDALLDPSIIDPFTGLPAAGKLTLVFNYNFRDDRAMQSGDRQHLQETLVRAGNSGINKAFFLEGGIPASAVDAMFAGPITIRMNMTGSAKLANGSIITANMRLFGD